MWPYPDVTRRQLEEKKDRVEVLLQALGAVPTGLGKPHSVSGYGPGMGETFLSQRTVFRCGKVFVRVDEVLVPEKPFLVLEYASRVEEVRANVMEDADPFPWDLGEGELLAELRAVLDAG